jgi:hypothetical protein
LTDALLQTQCYFLLPSIPFVSYVLHSSTMHMFMIFVVFKLSVYENSFYHTKAVAWAKPSQSQAMASRPSQARISLCLVWSTAVCSVCWLTFSKICLPSPGSVAIGTALHAGHTWSQLSYYITLYIHHLQSFMTFEKSYLRGLPVTWHCAHHPIYDI